MIYNIGLIVSRKRDDIRDAAEGWMNIPLICESLLGTRLWGLLIVAFSRKVIR